jgi:hypothetical protein
MKKHWRTIVVILLAAAVLTFFLRGLMRENIVGPLMYLAWIGQLVFWSIPQAGIWAFFIFIALVIALKSLVKRQPPPSKIPTPKTDRTKRIGTWAKSIRQADEDFYYQWQLAQELQKLTVQALANLERVERSEIRRRLEQGTIADMSPEILAYLKAGVASFAHSADKKTRFGLGKQTSPLNLDPEQVIQYLEDKIEHHPN